MEEHKNSEKMHFWLPGLYFRRQYDVVFIFRSPVALNLAIFHFGLMKLKFDGVGGIFSGNFKFLLKTTDKRQLDVKNDDF